MGPTKYWGLCKKYDVKHVVHCRVMWHMKLECKSIRISKLVDQVRRDYVEI